MSLLRALFTITFVLLSFLAHSEIEVIRGVYAGENLYIQQFVNKIDKTHFIYCVDSIIINDSIRVPETNYAAFEVDLTGYRLGDHLEIVIHSKEDCNVKVLNRHALEFDKDFIEVLELNATHVKFNVDWDIVDMVSLQFYQFQKWKNDMEWDIVDSIETAHIDSILDFDLKPSVASKKRLVAHMKGGGKNDYLVKELDLPDPTRSENCNFEPKKPKTEILLEEHQSYVIFNAFGEIVSQGKTDVINVSNLPKGTYHMELEFCKDMVSFVKK